MAKDQNTFAKRLREMEKKRKAEEKRERRRRKKEQAGDSTEAAAVNDAALSVDRIEQLVTSWVKAGPRRGSRASGPDGPAVLRRRVVSMLGAAVKPAAAGTARLSPLPCRLPGHRDFQGRAVRPRPP